MRGFPSYKLSSVHSIIPNSIHPKPRLLDIQPRHPSQKLILPPINLHKPLLIIAHSKPLVAPRTRADSITVASTSRRRVQTNLPLNRARLSVQFESRNVAGQFRGVAAGGGEEVFAAAGGEDDVGAVHFGVQGVVAGRDQGVAVVVVGGFVGLRVDGVGAEAVAGFHERVEGFGVLGEFDPAGVVVGGWGIDGGDEG
jgi:hypothetical protein